MECMLVTSQRSTLKLNFDDLQKQESISFGGLFSASMVTLGHVPFVFTMKSVRSSTKSMSLKGKPP